MKIHIIGGSGTGKSYLAEGLSGKYGVPHFDLDDLQWDNTADTYGIKMPAERRAALLREILEKDDWIVEGVYYKWVQESFEKADLIYILEIPEIVYKVRIIKRFIKRKLKLEKGKKETLKSLAGLIRWTDQYQKNDLKEIKKFLKGYPEKVVLLHSGRQISELIK